MTRETMTAIAEAVAQSKKPPLGCTIGNCDTHALLWILDRWNRLHPDRRKTRHHMTSLVTEIALHAQFHAVVSQFNDRNVYPERPALRIAEPGGPTVWILGWRQGDSTPIHDHITSEVAVYFERGRITETIYSPRYGFNSNCDVITREVYAPSLVTLPAPYIHKFVNDAEELAVSIHAYWPALRTMRYYELDDHSGHKHLMYRGEWKDEG